MSMSSTHSAARSGGAAWTPEGRLDRVLALYGQAMRLDPGEPAHPWNLASALNRLGLNDLALGFLGRAIHLAEERGDPRPQASLASLLDRLPA